MRLTMFDNQFIKNDTGKRMSSLTTLIRNSSSFLQHNVKCSEVIGLCREGVSQISPHIDYVRVSRGMEVKPFFICLYPVNEISRNNNKKSNKFLFFWVGFEPVLGEGGF